jgi:hypothetical protein
MQHLDDVFDHLHRLRWHLQPFIDRVYGLVSETLRGEGGKVPVWLENNLESQSVTAASAQEDI